MNIHEVGSFKIQFEVDGDGILLIRIWSADGTGIELDEPATWSPADESYWLTFSTEALESERSIPCLSKYRRNK